MPSKPLEQPSTDRSPEPANRVPRGRSKKRTAEREAPRAGSTDKGEKAEPARKRTRRKAFVNLRIATETRDLIDSAATLTGQTRSQFVVESAHGHAIDVLLDQRLLVLHDEPYAAFMKALDHPSPPNERLKQLLREKAPWEK